ncbi:MAG: acyloxyacyl hydrolase [Terracidiphilus sp.]
MTRIVKLFVLVILSGATAAGTVIAAAQTNERGATVATPTADNPVAQVRDARSWEYGPFVDWGTGIGDRSDYKFFWGGFQVAKPLTPVLHAGVLSGQFELGANIMPLWQAYTPAPHTANYNCIEPSGVSVPCVLPVAGGTYRGVSLTPVIFRWNFLTKSRRIQPWFQGAGGLIYTTREFPPSFSSAPGFPVDGSTSVWNFSPQGGVGIHYFTRDRRSIDLAVNAVHISSASLGDRNPGVNASLQVQVGYTFWK